MVACRINYILFYHCGIACTIVYRCIRCWKRWRPGTCEGVALLSGDRRNCNFTKLRTLQDIKCLRSLVVDGSVCTCVKGNTYITFWRMVACRINYILLILNNSIGDRRRRYKIARVTSFYQIIILVNALCDARLRRVHRTLDKRTSKCSIRALRNGNCTMRIGIWLYLKRIIVILKNGISALRFSPILFKRCRAAIRINLSILIKIGMEPHTCFIRGCLSFATLFNNIADKTRTLRIRLRSNQRTILFHHNLSGDCSSNCRYLSMCSRLCRRRVGNSLDIKRNIYMRTIAKCHNNGRLLCNSRTASRRLPAWLVAAWQRTVLAVMSCNNQFIRNIRRYRTRMFYKFFGNNRRANIRKRVRPIKACWR